MKSLLVLVISFSAAFAFPSTFAEAERCVSSKCKLEDGCLCAKPSSPLGDNTKTPQFVTLTFDDSVTSEIHENIIKLLGNRRNPDGSPASATVYVPHKYSIYSKVNDLYNRGFDIGVNSITKNTADYFANADEDLLTQEFDGQRTIVSTYANIPKTDIRGVRTPHFQLNGDKTFRAYKKSGLEYDSSWTTLSSKPLYPYTLDFKSNQQCLVGSCPVESFPGFVVAPINNFVGPSGLQCNVLFACQLQGSSADIRDWLIEQYENSHGKLRTPLSILVNSAFFQLVDNGYEGLERFLDYLGTKSDTFLVSHKEVVRWTKKPVPLGEYKPLVENRNQDCDERTCELPFGDETMYMVSCTECPEEYPWVGNPEGIGYSKSKRV